jgi:hypothetical protein
MLETCFLSHRHTVTMLTVPVTIPKMPMDVDIGLTNGYFSAAHYHLGMKSCLVDCSVSKQGLSALRETRGR